MVLSKLLSFNLSTVVLIRISFFQMTPSRLFSPISLGSPDSLVSVPASPPLSPGDSPAAVDSPPEDVASASKVSAPPLPLADEEVSAVVVDGEEVEVPIEPAAIDPEVEAATAAPKAEAVVANKLEVIS